MEIERATVADVPDVVDCWLALAREQQQYNSHVRAEPNRTRIRRYISRHASADRLLVARDDELAGFATVALERGTFEKDERRGLVEAIYVVPDRRGAGIGSALLDAAEDRLVALGATVVTLRTMVDNDDARRFYRRHGYDAHRIEFEKSAESDNHSKEDR